MKDQCKELLIQLSSIMKMTHIVGRYYRGELGSIFKMTNFGFIIADPINDKDYPHGK